jgi:hypothetical protein
MKEMNNGWWEPIKSLSDLNCGTLLYFWEVKDGIKTNNIQFIVHSLNKNYVTVRRMAKNGKVLPQNERTLFNYSLSFLIKKNAKFNYEITNEKESWPKNMDEAIKIIHDSMEENQLEEIRQLTWKQFIDKYNSFGGLPLWIRNNFGLWRGNFELLLNCKIDDIDADNASMSILYHFWEFMVYEKK